MPAKSRSRQAARLLAIACGLTAAALTDAGIVASGAGHFAGAPLGLLAVPLLLLGLLGGPFKALVDDATVSWLFVGAAWLAAPIVDQHLTHAVVIDGAFPDLVHHMAGWAALVPGLRRRDGERHPTIALGDSR